MDNSEREKRIRAFRRIDEPAESPVRKTAEEAREAFVLRILRYCNDYMRALGKAVPFYQLSRRYGKTSLRHGVELIDLLQNDSRFFVNFNPKRESYIITPNDEAAQRYFEDPSV